MNAVRFSGIRELPRHFAQAMAHTLAAENENILSKNPPNAKDEPERKAFAQVHSRYAEHHTVSARAYWDVVASDPDLDLFLAQPTVYVNQSMPFNLYAGDRRDQSTRVNTSIRGLIAEPGQLFSRITPDKAREWVGYAMASLTELIGGPTVPHTIRSGDSSIIYRPSANLRSTLWEKIPALTKALTEPQMPVLPPPYERRLDETALTQA